MMISSKIVSDPNKLVDVDKFSCKMQEVRQILGNDFLSPEEVSKACGWTYTDEQLAHFVETIPDPEKVLWLRTSGYMLVCGPVADTNLLGVRVFNDNEFRSHRSYSGAKYEDWYSEDKQKFARNDVVKGGEWLMFRKSFVPNSKSKNWIEQFDLVTNPEYISNTNEIKGVIVHRRVRCFNGSGYIPNVSEASYSITMYRKLRHITLFEYDYVRTSSVGIEGQHIIVGRQRDNPMNYYCGLSVCCENDKSLHNHLGLSFASK